MQQYHDDTPMTPLEEADTMQELRSHIRRIDDRLMIHVEELSARHDRHDEDYRRTMDAIAALAEATKGVVEAWTVVNALQRFVRWASAFAFIGGAAMWLLSFFKKVS
jgi:hypothetical protein